MRGQAPLVQSIEQIIRQSVGKPLNALGALRNIKGRHFLLLLFWLQHPTCYWRNIAVVQSCPYITILVSDRVSHVVDYYEATQKMKNSQQFSRTDTSTFFSSKFFRFRYFFCTKFSGTGSATFLYQIFLVPVLVPPQFLAVDLRLELFVCNPLL